MTGSGLGCEAPACSDSAILLFIVLLSWEVCNFLKSGLKEILFGNFLEGSLLMRD